jgi:hypothetical protein
MEETALDLFALVQFGACSLRLRHAREAYPASDMKHVQPSDGR